MYIHSYQIHNVLNVYRQQLSRGTTRNATGDPDKGKASQDRIDISDRMQRQTIFEKISSEIVQRITQFDPDTDMEVDSYLQSDHTSGRMRDMTEAPDDKSTIFSYTLIDTNNQKTTHNLSIQQLTYSTEKIKALTTAPSDGNSFTDAE